MGEDGGIVNADAQHVPDLLGSGYRLAGAHEVQADLDRQEHGEGLGNELAAGIEGAASGATLGLSDVAAKALAPEYAERLGKRRELNPISAAIGEGVGILGTAALSGGSGLAARIASATPAGLAIRAGMGAEKAVEGVIGATEAAGLATRALARGAAAGAGGATEGALFGAAKAASDDFLTDHEITAERIAVGAGLGALTGGGFGAISAGGSELVSGGVKALATKVRELLPDMDTFIGERAFKGALGGRNLRGVKDAKRYGGASEIGNTLIREVGPENLARMSVDDIAEFATKRTDELGAQLGRMGDEIEAIAPPSLLPSGEALKKRIDEEVIAPLRKHFGQDARAVENEYADFLDDLSPKVEATRLSAGRRRAASVEDSGAMGGLMGEVAPQMQNRSGSGLMGEVLEAAPAAGAGRKLTGSTSPRGTVDSGLMGGAAKPELTFSKLQEWRKALGDRADWKVMDGAPKAVVEAKRDLYRIVSDYWKETADNAASAVGREGFRAELEATNKTYSQLKYVEKISKQAADRDMANRFFSPSDYGIGTALSLGSAATSGDLDAGDLAMGFAGGLVHKVLRERGNQWISTALYSRSAKRPRALQQAIDGEKSVEAATDGFFARMRDGAASASAAAASGTSARFLGTSYSLDDPNDVDDLRRTLSSLSDPTTNAAQGMRANLAATAIDHPQLAASMAAQQLRVAQYLTQKIGAPREPRAGDAFAGLRKPVASQVQAARYARVVEAATNPKKTLERIARGEVNQVDVDALKALYPRLHARLVASMIDDASRLKELPSRAAQRAFAIVTGAASDRGTDPAYVAKLQRLIRTAPTASALAQSREQPVAPRRTGKAPKLANNMMTRDQSAGADSL